MSTRRIVQPVAALLMAAVFALAVGEIAVRVLLPQVRLVIEPGGFYIADPPGRYRLAPGYRGRITNRAEYDNEIRINEAGLRGPELAARSEDRLRVLAIGDSFTFGVGVEDSETFVAVLAEELNGASIVAEGLNAGTPAFGVPDAMLWLRRHGLELDPDVVVLAVFLGNDLIDASPDREEILVVDGLLVPGESPRGVKAWLFRNSQLYVAVKGLMELSAMRPLRSKLGLGEPWTQRVLREELDVYRRGARERFAEAVAATEGALSELAVLAAEHDFEPVVLMIPSEVQVDPERWAAAVKTLELDPADYDPRLPTRIFREMLARHAIPVVEPAQELAARIRGGENLYYRLDRHWTAGGHRLAAEKLAEALRPRLVGR